MENLRALPLTCVRVRLSTAGADVCDIMAVSYTHLTLPTILRV